MNRDNPGAPLWIGAILLLSGLMPDSAEPTDTRLIQFQIEDQFKQDHTDTEFRGRALILLISDRQGSQFTDEWMSALRDALVSVPEPDGPRIVEVADVRGVPFFVKGAVRGKFPKDERQWVLLDWKGEFAKAYELEAYKLNILVFDPTGWLQYQVAVTALDADTLANITDVLWRRWESSASCCQPSPKTGSDPVLTL